MSSARPLLVFFLSVIAFHSHGDEPSHVALKEYEATERADISDRFRRIAANHPAFTEADRKAIGQLFGQLESDDFEKRQSAMTGLIELGPLLLQEYGKTFRKLAHHDAADVRDLAAKIQQEIHRQYDPLSEEEFLTLAKARLLKDETLLKTKRFLDDWLGPLRQQLDRERQQATADELLFDNKRTALETSGRAGYQKELAQLLKEHEQDTAARRKRINELYDSGLQSKGYRITQRKAEEGGNFLLVVEKKGERFQIETSPQHVYAIACDAEGLPLKTTPLAKKLGGQDLFETLATMGKKMTGVASSKDLLPRGLQPGTLENVQYAVRLHESTPYGDEPDLGYQINLGSSRFTMRSIESGLLDAYFNVDSSRERFRFLGNPAVTDRIR